MAKTAAEKQKAYRERQKAKGPEFLNKEKLRVRKYFVPAEQLSKKKLVERNKKNMMRNRLSRLRKKQSVNGDLQTESQSDTRYSSMQVDNGTPEVPRLIVKLQGIASVTSKKAKGIETRRKRALARANRSIKSLENEVNSLKKKIKSRNKQIERLRHKVKKTANKGTLLKDTDADLQGIKMTPKRKSKVKRKLMLGNEIRKYRADVSRKARRPLHSILAGNVTKKYRLISALSKGTGCARNCLLKCNKKLTSSVKDY